MNDGLSWWRRLFAVVLLWLLYLFVLEPAVHWFVHDVLPKDVVMVGGWCAFVWGVCT